ncbi:hypothetical protein, partial [Mesorhizobium sp. M1322]|uniref:hypothetical protein n=1 Tax=Mesorhizobium sp. M1322 TaxID=2957081 RepID=UPI0033368ED0
MAEIERRHRDVLRGRCGEGRERRERGERDALTFSSSEAFAQNRIGDSVRKEDREMIRMVDRVLGQLS